MNNPSAIVKLHLEVVTAAREKVYALETGDNQAYLDACERSATAAQALMTHVTGQQRTAALASHVQDHRAREQARELAEKLWREEEAEGVIIRFGEMVETIKEALASERMKYSSDTIRNWLADIAPPYASQPGRPKNP